MSPCADPPEHTGKEEVWEGRVEGILCFEGIDSSHYGLSLCQGSRAFSKSSESTGKSQRPLTLDGLQN